MKGKGRREGVSKVVRTLRVRYLGSCGNWKPYKLCYHNDMRQPSASSLSKYRHKTPRPRPLRPLLQLLNSQIPKLVCLPFSP